MKSNIFLMVCLFILMGAVAQAINVTAQKIVEPDADFFNSDSEADYQKLKAESKKGEHGIVVLKPSDLTKEDLAFIKDARVFNSAGASAVEDIDMSKTVYMLSDDKMMNKTKFEMELEAKVAASIVLQNNILQGMMIAVAKAKSLRIQELEKLIQTEEADYNSYNMSLNRVIRRTEGNRYTDVALAQAKLEISETKRKFEIRKRSLELQIAEIRDQKIAQDFVKLDEDLITASASAIMAGERSFEELKKSYYTTKDASQQDFYRKLDALKKEYRENEKRFERYFEIESDVIVKKITIKQKGE